MSMIDQVSRLLCLISPYSSDLLHKGILIDASSYVVFLNEHGEADDKINAVCADYPVHMHFNNIKELPPHHLVEIRRFFEDYKKNENKEVAVNDIRL